MNNDTMSPIVRMEAEELRQLVTEVRETLATDLTLVKKGKRRIFGPVDLWNIQRKMKSASRPSIKGI